mmetsp:Transcript_26827/g.41939  ORF Transcript_26827/g.41939 Transcript_26827/m.41939 type:complete len:161 (-) Transcript_26827:741-1223(-)
MRQPSFPAKGLAERFTVPSSRGVSLATTIWRPSSPPQRVLPAIIVVHQWSCMGGSASLMHGIARELTDRGFTAVTFDMRGVQGSSGTMTLTGANEVKDVEAVCEWTHQKLNQDLVVLGSSAGAPIAGSAVESFSFIKAYVGIGYVFGWWASIIFGSHYKK